jgi:hypothetical protein
MTYDLDFRYRRALDPDGLTTLQTGVDAVQDAIKDARNAGIDPERDPAVMLLARHLARIAGEPIAAEPTSDEQTLRNSCIERLSDLKSKPAIIALVRRGVDYDPEAKRAFRREASRSLRQIAAEVGLTHDQYTINLGGEQPGPVGDVTLASDYLHLRISAGNFRCGREFSYRKTRSRHDEFSGTLHQTDIGKLSDIPKLARRIESDLELTTRRGQNRLF